MRFVIVAILWIGCGGGSSDGDRCCACTCGGTPQMPCLATGKFEGSFDASCDTMCETFCAAKSCPVRETQTCEPTDACSEEPGGTCACPDNTLSTCSPAGECMC